MRRLATISLLFIVVVFVAACGGGNGGQRDSVAVGLDSEPESLDASYDTGLSAALIDAQVYDTLFRVGENGQLQPGLVQSWKQPSPTVYRLTLRPGVTFHDGTPLNAQAVKTNLDRVRDPKGTSPWAGSLAPIKTVTVDSPTQLTLTLSRPYSPLPSVLATQAGMVVSPQAIKQLGQKVARHPVGTGPYKFVRWTKGQDVVLVKNPAYWEKGKPTIKQARFAFSSDPTTKITDLISGRTQTVDYVPANLISRVKRESSLTYKSRPASYANVVWLGMNTTKPPISDPALRQAISAAIDREAMVKSVAFGAASPARSMLSPGSWAYSDQVPPLAYNPGRAKQLLGGRKATVEIKVPPTYKQQAQVVKSDLAKVGITANIVNEDWPQLIDDYYKGNFQIEFQDLLGTPLFDPDMVLSGFYSPKGAFNGTGFSDPTIQRLLNEGTATADRDKRKQIYIELQKRAQEILPTVPIYYPDNNRAWSTSLSGDLLPNDGLIRLANVNG